jgi:signal peptidase II
MVQKSFRSLLIVLALIGAGLDQTSKYGVFKWLNHNNTARFDRDAGTWDFWPKVFKLHAQYTDEPAGESALRNFSSDQMPRVNHGALFGLFNHYPHEANVGFAVISFVAGIAIVGWSFRKATSSDALLCAALGLILAGTMGNLYDRIVFGGVRDFLYFYRVEWPVFNVADCCLVCGAFLLLAQAFLAKPVTVQTSSAREAFATPEVIQAQ